MNTRFFLSRLVIFSAVLALCVVMLGAYTRLTDAGLGCPDWPGCYGHLVLPKDVQIRDEAQKVFPDTPIEAPKAWTEMTHRYLAGTLALLIMVIGFFAWRRSGSPIRESGRIVNAIPKLIPAIMLVLVVFQALLGMWTVTLKLLPIVVMSHLLGGMILFSLLVTYAVQLLNVDGGILSRYRFWILAGLVMIFAQVALGGWVSSNYAGIACVGFPGCSGNLWPNLNFSEGFYLFSPIGESYQGGLLAIDARITIQWIHRLGAVITLCYWSLLLWRLHQNTTSSVIKKITWFMFLLFILQWMLGILNVLYLLPISVAVLHNGVAALLMSCALTLTFLVFKGNAYD